MGGLESFQIRGMLIRRVTDRFLQVVEALTKRGVIRLGSFEGINLLRVSAEGRLMLVMGGLEAL